jgi:predicted lipid-binding transport protein (Tim44 family)
MKQLFYMVFALFVGLGLAPDAAEAKRIGGGKPAGVQRQAAPDKPATPAAQPGNQANASQAAAVPPRRMSPWMGALAGLAAGLGLAWLLGDQLGSVVMAILLALAAVAVIGFLARRFLKPRAESAPQGMQYSALGRETVAPPQAARGGTLPGTLPEVRAQSVPRVPAGFNSEAFLREAKKSFVALQAANDRGDVESIREFVTDEMFDQLKRDIEERGAASNNTDVVTLNADLLELVTERGTHWASIRFSGLIREDGAAAPQQFAEIWNLQKPERGNAGWTLAGIQQTS